METKKAALVLGATGKAGGAIASALLDHGWQVRGLVRDLSKVNGGAANGVDWVCGDAMVRDDVVRAARGVSIIVHAVNPPGYRNWDTVVLPMIDNTIAAARAAGGARVVLPATIYNFDPETTPVITARTPQAPKSRKGRIRVALEKRLEDAAPEVPSLILRAGDFFGPGARDTWFAEAMVKAERPVKRIVNPARGGGHSWAYLPDFAEAFARLLDRPDQLLPFERLQFEGLFDESGTVMTTALSRVVEKDLPVWPLPWWLVRALAPFGGFPREAAEIAPHWRHPARLDNGRLVQLLGEEPRTDLDAALRQTLISMKCLAAGVAPQPERRSAAVNSPAGSPAP